MSELIGPTKSAKSSSTIGRMGKWAFGGLSAVCLALLSTDTVASRLFPKNEPKTKDEQKQDDKDPFASIEAKPPTTERLEYRKKMDALNKAHEDALSKTRSHVSK